MIEFIFTGIANAAVSGEFSIRVVPSLLWRRRGGLRY